MLGSLVGFAMIAIEGDPPSSMTALFIPLAAGTVLGTAAEVFFGQETHVRMQDEPDEPVTPPPPLRGRQ